MSKEWRLPPPPGRWRGENFCQSFINHTKEPITIHGHKQSVELNPSEEIEICWDPRETNLVKGYWELKLKQ
jgi:hypothetical protein